jgi:3-hydroxyacyl-CoA dehydrogenase / enoyl-CoA hydratase / 3-hydroxybutyryl-CoA epimerase
LEAKHALLKSLEARMKPDAILATNTSSLRLEDLRTVLARPERLTGIHFFNPVAMMPLVEVVQAEGADEDVTRRACAFVRQIEKLPLPVKSAPGFLVNAVLGPYMLKAMQGVDAGLNAASIDRAMKDFGMPMGPLELADTVGLDIAMAVGDQLAPDATPPQCLSACVQRGDLGKKTGKGFYRWVNGRPVMNRQTPSADAIIQELVDTLVAQTQRLVNEGIVADADLADAGVIFGTGFAPYTGGPLHDKVSGA